jgi:MOSC domain-containing protein YiiM
VTGRIFARRLNLDGDGQADVCGRGGEQRAIMVYQLDSHRYWATFLGRSDLVAGYFGENLTAEGLADNEVCIGDRFRIGRAVVEVSRPRDTCYQVGIRLNRSDIAALLYSAEHPLEALRRAV